MKVVKNVVTAEGLSKTYTLGKTEIPALRNIDLKITQGEFLVIAGPSGSGKTTLLNLIGLIDSPTSGKLCFDGIDVTHSRPHALYRQRRDRLGYIFQTFNLIPVLNVYENVEYPLILKQIPRKERKDRVRLVLEKVGLSDRMRHRPKELSGGQRQRVSIARAIAKHPEIILADEPTANLDSQTGGEILTLMQRLNGEDGTTFIFSSHDPKVIERGCRMIRLKDGSIQ